MLLSGTPLQYFCLENPMDGGAWWTTVHGVAKSRTRLSDFTFTYLIWGSQATSSTCHFMIAKVCCPHVAVLCNCRGRWSVRFSCSPVWDSVTPWPVARQASLSFRLRWFYTALNFASSNPRPWSKISAHFSSKMVDHQFSFLTLRLLFLNLALSEVSVENLKKDFPLLWVMEWSL